MQGPLEIHENIAFTALRVGIHAPNAAQLIEGGIFL
jgi:hypothetical protein